MKIESSKAYPLEFKKIPIKLIFFDTTVKISSVFSREMNLGSDPKTFGFWIIFILSKRNLKLVSGIIFQNLGFPFAVNSFYNSGIEPECFKEILCYWFWIYPTLNVQGKIIHYSNRSSTKRWERKTKKFRCQFSSSSSEGLS